MLPEVLVPIRLDIDMDGQKLRDTFTWNKNGTRVHNIIQIANDCMLPYGRYFSRDKIFVNFVAYAVFLTS